MKKNSQSKYVIGIIIFLIAGYFFWNSSLQKNSVIHQSSEALDGETQAAEGEAHDKKISEKNRKTGSGFSKPENSGQVTGNVKPAGLVLTESDLKNNPELFEKITVFKELQRKPLLTENEKKQRQQLFNAESLKSAADFLLNDKSIGSDSELQHQAVVDFLKMAVDLNISGSVLKVMEILKNKEIDNVKLPINIRQMMAKDKALLMFDLLATNVELKKQFNPSEVSVSTAEIYKNVQKEFGLNLKISEAEVISYNQVQQRKKGQ